VRATTLPSGLIFRFVLVGLAPVLTGCPRARPAPRPAVVEVRVVDRTPDEPGAPPRLDVRALGVRAAAAIRASSGLPVVDGGVGAGYRLRVEVRLDGAEDAASDRGVMRAFVQARATPLEPNGLTFEQAAVAERVYTLKERGALAEAWRAHAARAVEDVVRGLGERVHLAAGDARALVQALDGPDEDLQKEAVRLAGERRERAAVPSLVAMLKNEDSTARDRAIGALGAIGDARAVRPLTEVARFRDVGDLPKVLDALASIGGPESRAYLEFVASGHEDAEIRELAKQALSHLERHHDLAPP
jgi:hypothetical protein